MKYVFENKVEFYITNVCNLTCANCNRFNNHDFRGWQRWSDYAGQYRQWADLIELRSIVIMGGEPLLNASITDWITGLARTFGAELQILSNGLHLARVPGLYNSLIEASLYTKTIPSIGISLHNFDHFETIKQNIKEFLGPIIDESREHPGIYYSCRDENNVVINVYVVDRFFDAAVKSNGSGGFTLHNSNPREAFNVCGFARFKSLHFIRGKIYKCGPAALMPEFDLQYPLDISSEDRDLLHSYQPLTLDTWSQQHQAWMTALDSPIEQCKFCTVSGEKQSIFPVVKNLRRAK